MTHPTDNFTKPQPESGCAQESGDAGLSSNMRHKFSDKNALPVGGKGSSVIPIPTSELQDIYESTEMVGKIRPHPSEFGPLEVLSRMGLTEPESYPAAAEEGFLKLSTPAQMNDFTPQATLSESSQEEEAVSALPGTTAITEAEAVVGVDESYTMCNEVDTEGNPAKPKGPPLVPGQGRNRNYRRKRAAAKKWKCYLLCLMTFMNIPFCKGKAALKCFSCMDKDRCPKLVNIFESDDTRLYHRNKQPFPGCSGISAPSSKMCDVCSVESNITIICSGDVGKLEVEDSDGAQIKNTPAVPCSIMESSPIESKQKQQTSNPTLTVLIVGCVLLLQWWQR
ncbi:uncharacterized protein [Thunnus thynnus]|uniref:uncharacterized protein isoform X2 n=1 Tax=Thunnus thynnus TaxID=8237 RepID=UPI0035278B25